MDYIFKDLFSQHGLQEREGQTRLCHEMLEAMFSGKIMLSDAGTGIGKTYAYLAAAIVVVLPVSAAWPAASGRTWGSPFVRCFLNGPLDCLDLLCKPSAHPPAEGNGTGRPWRGAIHGPSGGLNCFQPPDSATCLTCRQTMRVSLCTRSGVVAHKLPCLFYRWS